MEYWRDIGLKILTTCLIFTSISLAALSPAFAQNAPSDPHLQPTRFTQLEADLPRGDNFHKVAPSETPSGFAVPRYVSLKVGTVNGRTGPSLGHSVAWQYRRRGLPLIVVAETEFWRKVRDIHGDESWIHKPALSGERMVLALEETSLYRRADQGSRIEAVIAAQALLKLESCDGQGWCKFRSQNGHKGWAKAAYFWGAMPL